MVRKNKKKAFYYFEFVLLFQKKKNICCLNGSRAQEFYNLSQSAETSELDLTTTSSFTINENDL